MKNLAAFLRIPLLSLVLLIFMTGCGKDKNAITDCSAGDLDCLLAGMRLTDPSVLEDELDPNAEIGINAIVLVDIPTVDMPPETAGGTAPQITTPPPAMEFDDPDTEQEMDIPFTDPNNCRPIVCYSICGGIGDSRRCTRSTRCSRSRNDGLSNGNISLGLAWRSYYPPTYSDPNNPTTTDQLDLQMQPISDPNCTEGDPTNVITGGGQAIGGVGVTVGVTVDQPEPTPTPDADDGVFSASECSGWTSLDLCSYQACASVSGSSCYGGWEDSHGHEYYCPCTDQACLTSKAQALTAHCSSN